jgi:23S rRNA (guanosine2251-2'-O)-methyltransferase
MSQRNIVLIAHNLRSAHNVGSLIRTCEGLGVSEVYLTGYTPYPKLADDKRLPHLSNKVDARIAKTSLGAEKLVSLSHYEDVVKLIDKLKAGGFRAVALEQDKLSISLPEFMPPKKIALIVGREVEGIEPDVLRICDDIIEIPMLGKKESFNVVQAAAMAIYHIRFTD